PGQGGAGQAAEPEHRVHPAARGAWSGPAAGGRGPSRGSGQPPVAPRARGGGGRPPRRSGE
ncbi:unnamed protein product, partial [Prorocentrum cordatum]